MKHEQGVMNAGILIETVKAAVIEHGATPFTELFVRIGEQGPTYLIKQIKGQKDQRGFRLIIETEILPELSN
jgi:hypothetical protein